MAGVIAARTLSENGITDFLIVEAESVLGGRMKETTFAGYTIELGANWVQGTRNKVTKQENPIWTLAQKYKLKNTYSNYDDLLTYDQNGHVDYLNIVNEAWIKFLQVIADAGVRKTFNLEDLSFAQGQNLAGSMPQTPYEKVADWWNFDFEYADTPAASSMIEAANNNNATFNTWSYENQFVVDPRGFATLVREEAKLFATSQNILYNSIVTKVAYSDSSVNVTLKDGTIILADYAICTFSIGVLQHNDVQFVPRFPAWKQEAIFTIKMVTYTKIFLKFSRKFWKNTQFFLYADPYQRGYYPQWQSLSEIGFLPGSNIIFVTVVTDQSYVVEAQSNNQTLSQIMTVLKSMFGNDIPAPDNFYYYRWTQNPLYRGSYSNWPTGTSECQYINSQRPVGRLFFSGEAYSKEYFGFVHGAYFEGLRTGQQVANCINGSVCETSNLDYSCKTK
ncbi:unnamed protein product [Rotaria sp. Silwood1]|nr:unnamed protein product [Rotaria sp. Silwood1]